MPRLKDLLRLFILVQGTAYVQNITRQLFARLNRHLPHRLVHRDPPNAQTVASTPIPPSLSEHCLKMALMDEAALWKTFGAHPEGLKRRRSRERSRNPWRNQLPAQKPSPRWVHLWVCYRNPFNILLTILGRFPMPPRICLLLASSR